MTTQYLFPTNAELTRIAQVKTPVLTLADPIFRWFPLQSRDASVLMWEILDNFTGLMQIRGINGQPPKVQPVALNTFLAQPGVYGEFAPVSERDLTERQDLLLSRRIDRIRYILWTLAGYGVFSVTAVNGAVVHTDAFPLQTFTASPVWSNLTTSHPLADLRAVKLQARGKGVSFGAGATLAMNQVTFNNLMANKNADDLGGRRLAGLQPINGVDELNRLLAGDGLPQVLVFDDGYLNDAGTFVPFLADGQVVVFGQRAAGQVLGAFRYTRNANNPGLAPGPYQLVDTARKPPMSIDVHDGFNGGPVIFYPGSIVRMNV